MYRRLAVAVVLVGLSVGSVAHGFEDRGTMWLDLQDDHRWTSTGQDGDSYRRWWAEGAVDDDLDPLYDDPNADETFLGEYTDPWEIYDFEAMWLGVEIPWTSWKRTP